MSDTDKGDAADSSADDRKVLFPGRDVTCKGESIRVMPLFFRQQVKASELLLPVFLTLRDAGQTFGEGFNPVMLLPFMLAKSGDDMIAFIGFCVKKPMEWFDDLPSDEGYTLAAAVVEENASFFAEKVIPILNAASARITAALGGVTSSLASKTSVTAAPKSTT